ncbi:hypothetical protein ABIA33_004962 [Streptacidiphilus sp. MAP12-16]
MVLAFVQAAVGRPVVLVICLQVVERDLISLRESVAVRRCRRGLKCEEIRLKAARKSLGRADGAEALHGAFALPGGLVRVLRPVVHFFVGAVFDGGHDLPEGGSVRAEFVGDHHPRH